MAYGPDREFHELISAYRSDVARWIAYDANPVWELSHIMLMANISQLLMDDISSTADRAGEFLATRPHPDDPRVEAWKQFTEWASTELARLRNQQDVYAARGTALLERLSPADHNEAEALLSRDFEAMKARVQGVMRARIEHLRNLR